MLVLLSFECQKQVNCWEFGQWFRPILVDFYHILVCWGLIVSKIFLRAWDCVSCVYRYEEPREILREESRQNFLSKRKKRRSWASFAHTRMKGLIRVWPFRATNQHMCTVREREKMMHLLIRVWEDPYVYETIQPRPSCVDQSLKRMALPRPYTLP